MLTGKDLKSLKVLRLLRVLRPLRMISRNEGLKLCVKSLLLSIPGIFNVIVLALIFLLIFGIFFTNLFKGKLFQCLIPSDVQAGVTGLNVNMIFDKWDCYNLGCVWVDQPNNFNNLLNSIYTLFAIATTDNWCITLFAAIDAVGVNL